VKRLVLRTLVAVVLFAGLAGCDRTEDTGPSSASSATSATNAAAEPQPTVQYTGTFACPAPAAMASALGVPFANQGTRDAGGCQYGEGTNGGGRSVVVLHPPYSTTSKQETLAEYERDGQAAGGRITKRPEYGPGAFELFTNAQICAIWMPAVDGLPIMVQVNVLGGAPFDACTGARAAARLFTA
jgi:hypothetical protein